MYFKKYSRCIYCNSKDLKKEKTQIQILARGSDYEKTVSRLEVSVGLVAGDGFEPPTFRL